MQAYSLCLLLVGCVLTVTATETDELTPNEIYHQISSRAVNEDALLTVVSNNCTITSSCILYLLLFIINTSISY